MFWPSTAVEHTANSTHSRHGRARDYKSRVTRRPSTTNIKEDVLPHPRMFPTMLVVGADLRRHDVGGETGAHPLTSSRLASSLCHKALIIMAVHGLGRRLPPAYAKA